MRVGSLGWEDPLESKIKHAMLDVVPKAHNKEG